MTNTLDAFTTGYVECLLWSSKDNADDSGGAPLDDNYDESDIDEQSLLEIVEQCRDFQESNAKLLARAYAARPTYDASHAGYDFWLTRVGHGSGFWDRGFGQLGDELTKAAKAYGSIDPSVSEGKVYVG